MKDIENKFGKTILHDKVFVGGGSEKFLGAVGGKVRNNVEEIGRLAGMEMLWDIFQFNKTTLGVSVDG